MLLVGRTGSVYDYGGGFTFDGSDYDFDDGADQVRLSWAMSGFGVQLAIEDPRDKLGHVALVDATACPTSWATSRCRRATGTARSLAGFAETGFGSGFGVQAAATFKLDSIAPGDQLRLKAAWAQNQVWKYAAPAVPQVLRLVACGARWRRSSTSGRRLCRPRSRSTTTTRAVLRRRREQERLPDLRQLGLVAGHWLLRRCRGWLHQGLHDLWCVVCQDPLEALLVVEPTAQLRVTLNPAEKSAGFFFLRAPRGRSLLRQLRLQQALPLR